MLEETKAAAKIVLVLGEACVNFENSMAYTKDFLLEGDPVLSIKDQLAVLLTHQSNWEKTAEQQDVRIAHLAQPSVVSTAAQVLLVACGASRLNNPPVSTYFSKMAKDYASVQAVALLARMSPETFISTANGIVTQRNGDLHFRSIGALDAGVKKALVQVTPSLRHLCPWEVWVIENYEEIKKCFEANFSNAETSCECTNLNSVFWVFQPLAL